MVKHLVDVPFQALEQEQRPGAFQAAAGRTGTGADDHEQQQNALGKGRPPAEICSGKAGGGHDGGHLEGRVAEGFPQGGIKAPEIPGNQERSPHQNSQIHPQLLILEHTAEIADEQQIIAAEIDAEQCHEHGGHVL